jgi:decaprenylphospho-beta-D-erythro-pentofuranosid-2-ulose 2-reductase
VTPPFRYAAVVGASSGIGAAIARELAGEGTRVALLARHEDALRAVAAELPAGRAWVYPHDVTASDAVPALVDRVAADLGGLDCLVYAAGVMPRVGRTEYSFAADREVMFVNVVGAMAWIDAVLPRFLTAGRGTIVGISSVAGDRGRAGDPAYHASKAGLDAYLEALRARVARSGIRIMTAKPGPVDTPMSRGRDRLPLLISAERAAREIVVAARRGARVTYVPRVWRPIMWTIRAIPRPLFERLDL